MEKDLRIVFMGTPDFATASLAALVENGYNVVGAITVQDKPAGRGQKLRESSIKKYAVENNIPVLQPSNLKDKSFLSDLKNWQADVQVIVAFRMLPKLVWNMPKYGTFNLHASLLPKYRGAAPINWAVINGDKVSGVTTFFIDDKIDTGNIIFQEKETIKANDDAGTLHDKLMKKGSNLVCKTIDAISQNKAPNLLQEGESSLAPKIFKEDCKINWTESAKAVQNRIKGMSPYPTAWTQLQGKPNKGIKVFKSFIDPSNHSLETGTVVANKTEFKVAVKDGFIGISELQLSGKKRMTIEDFLRGFNVPENCFVK
jgi:methionyl-tRNA formyltransferase